MGSGVLPFLHEALGEQKCTIFDLGPPTSTKCAYLCRSGAQVYWDNTRSSVSNVFHGDIGGAKEASFRDWKAPDFVSRVDLVLAWSYFEYLELEEVRKLVSQLSRRLKTGSRIYFLIQHGPEIPETPPAYELERNDVLRYTPDINMREAPCYPPKMLQDMMPGFEIEKLYLMSNGIQEHLFYKQ